MTEAFGVHGAAGVHEAAGVQDAIRLTGMTFRASHGVLGHERAHPQTFIVDLMARVDLGLASVSDDLADSLDYSHLSAIVASVVLGPPVYLIEHLAGLIADAAMAAFPKIHAIAVTVHKPHAPLNELVADVSVTVNRVREERPAPSR